MDPQTSYILGEEAKLTMSDLNRGAMKFDGADKPLTVAVSAIIILGSIGILIVWALQAAYVL